MILYGPERSGVAETSGDAALKIICPNCDCSTVLDPADWTVNSEATLDHTCPECQSRLQVAIKVGPAQQDAGEECRDSASTDRFRVLVAVDGEVTRDLIREILSDPRYELIEAEDGLQVLSLVAGHRPHLAVLDAGLSQKSGRELCQELKRDESTKDVKLVLLSAIGEKPSNGAEVISSCGADAYQERNHLQEGLMANIQMLLQGGPAQPSLQQESQVSIQTEQIAELSDEAPGEGPADSEVSAHDSSATAAVADDASSPEHETARRLARTILSDIVLYNADRAREAIANNTFCETLHEEIEEGRRLYNQRVSPEIRSHTDYFHEVIENYIHSRQ